MAKKPGKNIMTKPSETPPAEAPAAAAEATPVEVAPEAKPVEVAPEAKPVEVAPEAKPVEVAPVATVATTEDLLGNLEPTAPAEFAGEDLTPRNVAPPVVPADNGKQGCQCDKCKEAGNRDKRGRHHKDCPCPLCAAKRGEVPPNGATIANPFEVTTPTLDNNGQKYQVMASMTFDMAANGLSMLLGPEWQPQSKEERKGVVDALATYYQAKGVEDLPPGMMLALVVAAYSAPRLVQQNTKSKLTLAWHWCKVKLGGVFKRKAKP